MISISTFDNDKERSGHCSYRRRRIAERWEKVEKTSINLYCINFLGSGLLGRDTNTRSDRCLEAFHCSSAVSGWWAIEPCPFERHSIFYCNKKNCKKLTRTFVPT